MSNSLKRGITSLTALAAADITFSYWQTGTLSDSRLALASSGATRFVNSAIVAAQIQRDYKRLFQHFEERGYKNDAYRDARSSVHACSADRVVALCKLQGGVYLKIGQHAASLTHALPDEFTSRLVVLQDDCPHDSFLAVNRTWDSEFPGLPLHAAFQHFDPVPIASASLAQVHRARTMAGHEVAVKIQHPGLAFRVAVDLATIRIASVVAHWRFPDFDLGFLIPELNKNLAEEMDFHREAMNTAAMKQALAECPRAAVPEVVWPLSTKRVLTMEYVSGCRVSDVHLIARTGLDPSKVAQVVTNIFSHMTFVSGFIHCDPHPGNLLVRFRDQAGEVIDVRASGNLPAASSFEVVTIDHGLCRQIDPTVRQRFCMLWRGLVLRDPQSVENASELLGLPGALELWSLFLLNRSWDTARRQTNSELRGQPTREEMRKVSKVLRGEGITKADFMKFIQNVPRDLLLVFKINSLARNIIQTLCDDQVASINRFITGVRYAVHGLHFGSMRSPEEWEQHVNADNANSNHLPLAAVGKGFSWLSIWDMINLELRLATISILSTAWQYLMSS